MIILATLSRPNETSPISQHPCLYLAHGICKKDQFPDTYMRGYIGRIDDFLVEMAKVVIVEGSHKKEPIARLH